MKVAIIGCGSIAKNHLEVLKEIENIEIVACVDIIKERADEYGKYYNSKSYYNIDDVLGIEKLDVIHICTPHNLHLEMIQKAAKKGVNVLVEKPPFIKKENYNEIEKLSKEIKIGIVFQNRYNENNIQCKNILDSKKMGEIKGVRSFVTWSRNEDYYKSASWRGYWETEGGGALINQSIHTLDLITNFFGRPEFVEANISNHHLKNIIEVEDTLEAYIKFENFPVIFYVTTAYSINAPIFIEIHCENGFLRLIGQDLEINYNDGTNEKMTFEHPELIGKNYWGIGHKLCIEEFYNSIKNNTKFSIEVEDVKNTMDLVFSIYESSNKKEVVSL